MSKREQFEERFPMPKGVEWDESNQCYKCKVPSPYLGLWMGWTAALQSATTCPGHGRPECATCCWPAPAGYTAVDMSTAAADGYRDAVEHADRPRVQELVDLLLLAKAHVPITDPLRGLINANIAQHLIERGPKL